MGSHTEPRWVIFPPLISRETRQLRSVARCPQDPEGGGDMPKALLVYPEQPRSFWSFEETLRLMDKKSAFPPLGLLTIAGMMPRDYDLRVVDMNVAPLTDHDLAWADIVITSSMIIHWDSLETVIARCDARGVPALCGGPLPTQYCDELRGEAVFFRGEAENGFLDLLERMLADSATAGREIIDRRGEFRNLAETPLPRWDLINIEDYSTMSIQITRGCPETCTFCNIPSLYGRTTRLKSRHRMVEEFDALYDIGWRGAIMVVDDNFVGNQEAIRLALEEEVIDWQRERGYPFQLNTQVSVRLSDNPALLRAMNRAGFGKIFCGIESPSEESLKFMGAQKNLQGDTTLIEKVRVLQKHGLEVQAGLIVGLDTDPDDIAERMVQFLQEAGITVAMVGILGVLRDTPDYKRFKRAGRLNESARYRGDSGTFSRTLSFVPLIDPQEILDRHRSIVAAVNSPAPFFERCLTNFRHQRERPPTRKRLGLTELRALGRSLWLDGVTGSYRREYWRFLGKTLRDHPRRFADAISLSVQGRHLILTTQRALQEDEMRTFGSEAVAYEGAPS
jgi:radical SAM superfamily enzyme YgiQ (UPF0313 family)